MIFGTRLNMIAFQNSKKFKMNELGERSKTISTLLVPSHLLNELRDKKKEHGNRLTSYFTRLLKMYRTLTHSGLITPPRKIKTEYQEEGLDLKRVSFRVKNSDWLEIGELALAFGKSRCWVFTFLLELDIRNLWDMLVKSGLDNAVPTTKKLGLKVSLRLRRFHQDFTRSYYVRI